mgnify:CR=1 FL=1
MWKQRHSAKLKPSVWLRKNVPNRNGLPKEQRKAEEARLAAEKAEAEKAAQQNTLADTPSETKITNDYHLSLRANLLRWATLTPDLGLEWRICPSWGIAVNGSWTSWSWSDKDRRYALWEVAPEVRYYSGEKKLVSGCYVQGRTVQLQALRYGQAGRPDGWRHHCRLPAAAEQGIRS